MKMVKLNRLTGKEVYYNKSIWTIKKVYPKSGHILLDDGLGSLQLVDSSVPSVSIILVTKKTKQFITEIEKAQSKVFSVECELDHFADSNNLFISF